MHPAGVLPWSQPASQPARTLSPQAQRGENGHTRVTEEDEDTINTQLRPKHSNPLISYAD